jgi:ribosomal protein S18 acetylase RimI-like enzyme
MRIRPAGLEDAIPIAEVHVAAWQAAYRGLVPDSYLDELTVEKRLVLWQRRLAQRRSASLVVAEDQKSLAGFCLFGPTRDEDGKNKPIGEIIALNVRPGCWRRGFGRALCDFALREAPSRGWTAVTLWILKGNQRASRFYEALGFALDGTNRIDTEIIGAPIYELRYSKAV